MIVKRNRLKIAILIVIIILSLFSLFFWQINRNSHTDALKIFEEMETHQIEITNDENQMLIFQTKIADDSNEQEAGFQHVDKMTIEKTIILFVFQSDIYGQFHMRNVEAPLDIVFIKSNGAIIAIMRMDPSSTQIYGPNDSFRYAIEARAEFFKDNKISADRSRLITESIP
jgi:uncharacterized membrane protein (UPF0127 family)